MGRYQITDAAKADVREILAYVRSQSPQGAKQVRESLNAAFRRLADFPHIGHLRTDVARNDLRFWSVYSYLIAYRPASKPIQIIRVIHGARDVPHFFAEP